MANEKRLIDLDEAMKAINDEIWWTSSEKAYFRSFLLRQKRVDAVEVVHGEWTIIEDDYEDVTILECSVCETSFRFDEYDGLLPQAQTYHYCPNCGAKMDGDGNG